MPVVGNRFYNDPAIGAAFANIAGMFAPPSAQDSLALARAAAEKNDAARATRTYDMMVDPNTPQDIRDLYGVASKTYAPTQSWRALDMGDATTRRGQDVESGDRRYGVDVGARTSITNNTADNTRALQTSAMDNQQRTIASLYGQPLNPGQVMPAVPGEIAGLVGLPGIDTRLGAPKPMSMDEMRAATFGQLPQGARDRQVMGDVPVEQIIDPVTGEPKIVYRPDAVNQRPYDKPGATGKPTNGLAVLPDGSRVPAIQTADGKWANAQTGEVLPAEIQVFDMPKPQGTAQEVGIPGKSTEFTDKNAIFYNRAAMADGNMQKIVGAGYVPSVSDFELMLGGAGDKLPMSLTNSLVSDAGRQFYNSSMGFMMSVLRPDTGAAFGKDEFQNYARIFIPLPHDDPKTIEDKKNARATALAALQGTSRGAADEITRLMISQGVPVPDEMRNHMAAAAQKAGGLAPTAPPVAGAPATRMRFDANGDPIQ